MSIFVTWLLLLRTSTSCCHAFVSRSTSRASLSSKLAATPRSNDPPRRNQPKKKNKQKRPPRFAQTVHKPTAGAPSAKDVNTDRVWQSRKKSVEELEEIMAQRWGTNLSSFTAQDWDDDDDDDDDDEADITSASPAPVFRAKPVVDPWEDTTTKKPPKKEYYDEDDEGFEKRKGTLGYMIAPKPAGGSGRTSTSSDSSQGSYFLRPPPREVVSKSNAPETTVSDTAKPARTKRQRAEPLVLLDEGGNPICLTTLQAEHFFEAQTSLATMIGNLEEYDNVADEQDESFPLASLAAQTNQDWSDLGIDHGMLLENLEDMRCFTPLPVQISAGKAVLEGNDVVIGTYTGSGKTLAFLAPLLQQLMNKNIDPDQLSILVVAPGRELASQIASVARQLCEGTEYTAQLAIGGTTFARNLQTIRQRKPSILVGTPGRLTELIVGKPGEKGGRLKVTKLQTLVLDEFDALLEYKPHREPTSALVQRLQRQLPNLQSILCSATATDVLGSPKFQSFVRPDYFLALTDQDDIFVTESDESDKQQPPRVSRTVMHGVVHVPHRRFVIDTLRRILHTEPLPQQILMFVDNSRKVDLLVEKLEEMGILAAALHGGSRNDKMDRAEVSKALREGYVGIVVATELAARGLDAPLLTHVVNVDLPTDASHYAHRSGRCGRGGRPGVVINITSDPKERKVPQKFANQLGIGLYTVDVRNGRLNVVDPDSVDFENL